MNVFKYMILNILCNKIYDFLSVTLCLLCAFCVIAIIVVAQKSHRSNREPQSVSHKLIYLYRTYVLNN
jgi:hypothetical protein